MAGQQENLCELVEAGVVPAVVSPRVGTDAIAAGLQFLSRRQGRKWSSSQGPDLWTTAYVLARLGELPRDIFTPRLTRQIEDSLDWLEETQTPGGGWRPSPAKMMDDASCTAWAILALRQHRRTAPRSATNFLRQCRRPDGAFVPHPCLIALSERSTPSLPVITAIVIRALGIVTSASVGLLEQALRAEAASVAKQTLKLLICSHVLDWDPGATPSSLRNTVHQSVQAFYPNRLLDEALLLRCLVRLRLQKAGEAAAGLCRSQRADGAWIGTAANDFAVTTVGTSCLFMESPATVTVTALSALVLRNLQPGICFGPNLPYRRLDEAEIGPIGALGK